MEGDLKGPFRLMAVVGDQMARTGGGSIINISSIGSQRPSAGEATYSAAKAGLNALTPAFAPAYAPAVRVHCAMPGAFATDTAHVEERRVGNGGGRTGMSRWSAY